MRLERGRARFWNHTIDVAPGLTTDGWFDLRAHVPQYGLPRRMDGMRVLDIERFADLCHGRLILAEEYDRLASLVPFPVSRYRADRDAAVVFWLPARKT